jgi:hypothetical protein
MSEVGNGKIKQEFNFEHHSCTLGSLFRNLEKMSQGQQASRRYQITTQE